MTDGNKELPHDVKQLLEQSEHLLQSLESSNVKSEQSEEKVNELSAEAIRNPAKPPEMPELPEGSEKRALAMEYLMRDKNYLMEEDLRVKMGKLADQSKSIVAESLSSFFNGNVPDLDKSQYETNAKQHAAEVLAENAPEKLSIEKHSNIRTTYRTLSKSIDIFNDFMREEIPIGASIFTYSLKAFEACWFLLADLKEALKIDSKEEAEAVELVLGTLKSGYSDQESGLLIQTAEIARLKDELLQTNELLESNYREAKNIILELENKRKAENELLEQCIKETECARNTEVTALLEKEKEFSEEVETLRQVLRIIQQDESVTEVEKLKQTIEQEKEELTVKTQEITGLQNLLEQVEKQFSDYKVEESSATEEIENLKFELQRADMQRDICKNCGQKIRNETLNISKDLLQQARRNNEILDKEFETQKLIKEKEEISGLYDELKTQIEVNESDKLIYEIDMETIVKEILLAESRLADYPQVEKLQGVISDEKMEISRLELVEKDYLQLKVSHKQQTLESPQVQHSLPTNNEAEGVSENQITLLRTQPLYLLLQKQYELELIESYDTDKFFNPNCVTSEYVQSIICKFLHNLAVTSLCSGKTLPELETAKVIPVKVHEPSNLSESATSLFIAYVREEFSVSNNENSEQEADLMIAKVSFVLQKIGQEEIQDETGFLSLANCLFNQPLEPDELEFLLFALLLSSGGELCPILCTIELAKLKLTDVAQNEYLTMKRAQIIMQILLNKAVLEKFTIKLLEIGRQEAKLLSVNSIEASRYDIIDANLSYTKELVPDLEVSDNMQNNIIELTFFVEMLLRAYRTEQLVRVEALRTMYAGDLLENNERTMSTSSRYRIVTNLIKSINPLAPTAMVNEAYLDAIWRSPNALWVILIDACRSKGVFSDAFRTPPVDVCMQICGGYSTQKSTYNYEEITQQFVQYGGELKEISAQLLQSELVILKQYGVQLEAVLQTDLSQGNVLLLINTTKEILLEVVVFTASLVAAKADDFALRKRLPGQISADLIDGFIGVLSIIFNIGKKNAKKI